MYLTDATLEGGLRLVGESRDAVHLPPIRRVFQIRRYSSHPRSSAGRASGA